MKNPSLIFNGILAIAVAALFYFQFAAEAPETNKNSVDSAAVDSVSNKLKIAYVHTDSLWENYKLIDDLQAELELEKSKSERKVTQRTSALERQLEQMGLELQTKAGKFEQQAQGMNDALRNMRMKELEDLQRNAQAFSMQAEQEMMELQQRLQQKLLAKELKGTKEVNRNIKDFLKVYNQDYDFTYVLAYSDEAGGILLGNPTLDITKDVVAGLNAIYDEELEAEKGD